MAGDFDMLSTQDDVGRRDGHLLCKSKLVSKAESHQYIPRKKTPKKMQKPRQTKQTKMKVEELYQEVRDRPDPAVKFMREKLPDMMDAVYHPEDSRLKRQNKWTDIPQGWPEKIQLLSPVNYIPYDPDGNLIPKDKQKKPNKLQLSPMYTHLRDKIMDITEANPSSVRSTSTCDSGFDPQSPFYVGKSIQVEEGKIPDEDEVMVLDSILEDKSSVCQETVVHLSQDYRTLLCTETNTKSYTHRFAADNKNEVAIGVQNPSAQQTHQFAAEEPQSFQPIPLNIKKEEEMDMDCVDDATMEVCVRKADERCPGWETLALLWSICPSGSSYNNMTPDSVQQKSEYEQANMTTASGQPVANGFQIPTTVEEINMESNHDDIPANKPISLRVSKKRRSKSAMKCDEIEVVQDIVTQALAASEIGQSMEQMVEWQPDDYYDPQMDTD